MPAKYEEIRDKFLTQGYSRRMAEMRAARIYNAQRKPGQTPMGPQYEAREKKRDK